MWAVVPPEGLEPTHLAPEASALSAELRGHITNIAVGGWHNKEVRRIKIAMTIAMTAQMPDWAGYAVSENGFGTPATGSFTVAIMVLGNAKCGFEGIQIGQSSNIGSRKCLNFSPSMDSIIVSVSGAGIFTQFHTARVADECPHTDWRLTRVVKVLTRLHGRNIIAIAVEHRKKTLVMLDTIDDKSDIL